MSVADKLTTIAENMQGVYDKGYADGQAQGGGESATALWDAILRNGERTDFQRAFAFWGAPNGEWQPNHDMKGNTYAFAFYACNLGGGSIPELCSKNNVILDFSKANSFNQCFSYCGISDIGTIDTSGMSTIGTGLLYASAVETARFILKADGSQVWQNTFGGATGLKNLTIESGAIGRGLGIPSPLTPESMISVITHLVNYKGTDNEFAYTISFTDACWEALEAHSTAPDGGTWKNYVQNNLGWNI